MMKKRIFIIVFSLFLMTSYSFAEEISIPQKLAILLNKSKDLMAKGKVKEAVRGLKDWGGKDHALRHLMLGQALETLSMSKDAQVEYMKAIAMDKGLKQAGIALARLAANSGDWKETIRLLGIYLDTAKCDSNLLLFYTRGALEANDNRLAKELIRTGVLRFPLDIEFRRADLTLSVTEGDSKKVARLSKVLLSGDPGNVDLWGQLAWSYSDAGQDKDSLVALEARYLCKPTDISAFQNFVSALIGSGDWITAVKEGKQVLAAPNASKIVANTSTIELLIQAADIGGEEKLLLGWLALVPQKDRTRTMHIIEARSALRRGKVADARKAIEKIIESGKQDASVYLWVGHIAESNKDSDAALVYYKQARQQQGDSGSASLYLARLYYRLGRDKESADILEKYLASRPEDSAARAMLSLVKSRAK